VTNANQIIIDQGEHFAQLRHAPIVEAALEIRARATGEWDEANMLKRLKRALPKYPHHAVQREFQHKVQVGPQQRTQATFQDLGFKGFQFRSENRLQLAQFSRDGFAFSRLKPYENWRQFSREAMRLWQLYLDLARPTDVQRLGLRFINRFTVAPGTKDVGEYLMDPPKTPDEPGFPFILFFHRDTMSVPGYSYLINVIRTMELPQKVGEMVALIIDIDVFDEEAFVLNEISIDSRIAQMRWLKNKVFFGNITTKALEEFK
jgi:uncharacterized protein (TIGR04255 family)